jgi:thymidylate synthase (FAD)
LMHFLSLRCDSHAQYEIRAYANVMAGMLKRVAPLSFEAWVDYSLTAKTFSQQEIKLIRETAWVLTDEELKSTYGLTKREAQEFKAKLEPCEVPDFTLDPSTAKTAEYYEKLFASTVPA